MTEFEWLTAGEPTALLLFLRRRGMQRKLRIRNTERRFRLFAAACCRRIWSLMTDGCRSCVEVAERFADGHATAEELQAAERQANALCREEAGFGVRNACLHTCAADMAGTVVCPVCHASTNVIAAVFKQRHPDDSDLLTALRDGACPEEADGQIALLRCIFGNPFRPVAFHANWRSETAVALASAIYADQAFDRLTILADALEEAGGEQADVLTHCRGPGPHARGCWVVDGVLGME